MNAEIITIGDEILIGQIVDTNSAHISRELNDAGIRVGRKYSIGDDEQEITDALSESLSRSEVVIITGGLGPTKDDITKRTFARIFNCGMVRHQPTYDIVEDFCTRRGLDFNVLNQAQADVPECCDVLLNVNGTAPGMWFEQQGKVIVALPGVPFEMKELMIEVVERLKKHFALKHIVHRTAVIFGIGESSLALRIEKWEDALPEYLHLAYLPNPAGIRLRLSAYDVSQSVAIDEIERQFEMLSPLVGDALLGFGEINIYGALANVLREKGLTLSIAESCTGGYLSSMFTAMSGASEYLKGSVVSYSNEVKADVLGVSTKDIERYGAVSQTVARQMAEGVKRICHSDCSIAITGVAGPDGGTEQKPIGTVWIAVSTPWGTSESLHQLGTLRQINIERASSRAADNLRKELLSK